MTPAHNICYFLNLLSYLNPPSLAMAFTRGGCCRYWAKTAPNVPTWRVSARSASGLGLRLFFWVELFGLGKRRRFGKSKLALHLSSSPLSPRSLRALTCFWLWLSCCVRFLTSAINLDCQWLLARILTTWLLYMLTLSRCIYNIARVRFGPAHLTRR